jgi:protease-4
MEDVYGVFKNHVSAARSDKLAKPIDQLAGGRVFTGAQAMELGLVDKIGGLREAIAYAARQASISDYDVRVVPEPKDFFQMMFGEMTGSGERPSDISVRTPIQLFGQRSPLLDAWLPALQQLDPIKAKALMSALGKIELLRRESVLTVMPVELVIR